MFWIDLGREGVVEKSFLYTKGSQLIRTAITHSHLLHLCGYIDIVL